MNLNPSEYLDKHPCETKWNLFRVLFALHRHFKAVAKVDVHNFAGKPIQHQI